MEVGQLLTQVRLEQVVLVAVDRTEYLLVVGQSPQPMVQRVLLVKDMAVEMVESQTIMVEEEEVAVHLLAEMRVHQLAVMAALAQHQA
jgi:hypothetical protein